MNSDLSRLRVRLTAWYVAVFAVLLAGFGMAALFVTTHEISRGLDASLSDAVDAVVLAAQIREREGPAGATHVDALDELRIPGRNLYLFNADGVPLHPDTANAWLSEVARNAVSRKFHLAEKDLREPESSWRAYARSFTLADGKTYIGLASADVLEIEDRYPAVVLGFAGAALLSLMLAGAGGWMLAHRSIRPAEEAFAGMQRFMTDAAHELRTPVTVLKAHTEVALRRSRSPEEYASALASINAEAGRLAAVLENVLVIARADAGAWPVTMQPLYLDDITIDALDGARALAAAKDITVTVEELDEVPVEGDPALLRQLLVLLLDNAVKFTPAGGHVAVSVRRDGTAGIVCVRDSGPGIDPALVESMFERFARGPHAREIPGAGLGLSIARWIVKTHGATIAIQGGPSGGTEVRVSFPVNV